PDVLAEPFEKGCLGRVAALVVLEHGAEVPRQREHFDRPRLGLRTLPGVRGVVQAPPRLLGVLLAKHKQCAPPRCLERAEPPRPGRDGYPELAERHRLTRAALGDELAHLAERKDASHLRVPGVSEQPITLRRGLAVPLGRCRRNEGTPSCALGRAALDLHVRRLRVAVDGFEWRFPRDGLAFAIVVVRRNLREELFGVDRFVGHQTTLRSAMNPCARRPRCTACRTLCRSSWRLQGGAHRGLNSVARSWSASPGSNAKPFTRTTAALNVAVLPCAPWIAPGMAARYFAAR